MNAFWLTIHKITPKSVISSMILALFVAVNIVPTAVLAGNSDNSMILANISEIDAKYGELTLTQNTEGRLLLPHMSQLTDQQDTEKPDKIVKTVITAYTSTVDQCDDDPFIAAWGDKVYDGMIAANWLPRNTKVKIPSLFGDKIFTVADRMNARYGYGRIDIWFDSSKGEARKFGVKRVDIEIYYPEAPAKVLAKK